MIIKQLVLHNFGVYAGTNTFSFSGKKPIVLIGGMNGRGKTTCLEAILLSLYGANSYAYKESVYKTYGQYLRSYVNKNDNTNQSYVELSFQMSKEELEEYLIRREWNACGQRTHETIHVNRNGEYSEFLTTNWPMFIENMLPSALSNFFFFDGEKVAELAVDNTDDQMKNSIRSMLGLSTLDTLNSDLKRIINKLSKSAEDKKELDNLEELRKKKEKAEGVLSDIDSEIRETQAEVDSNNICLEEAHTDYIAKGGDIVEKRQELMQNRMTLAAHIEQGKEGLIDEAATKLPLLLVNDLLLQIKIQAEKEQKTKNMENTVNAVNKVFSAYSKEKKNKGAEDFVAFLNKQVESRNTEITYNLSEHSLMQLSDLTDKELQEERKKANNMIALQKENEKQKDTLDSYLSVDINEKDIKEAYKRIRELEQRKVDLEVKLDTLTQKRVGIHGDCIKKTSDFNSEAERVLGSIETNDDIEREIKYAHIAQRVTDEYTVRLQTQKVEDLACTITKCYKQLANKKTLIEYIKMDPVTLDLIYMSKQGDVVPKEKLSAGEKQLMVIAILWALARCSKKKLPVIIDTPLSRLDSAHRKALITSYFPNASEQTIILSTDTEIDERYYRMMKNNISDEYYLKYDEDTKSTSIERGYFSEVKNNDN